MFDFYYKSLVHSFKTFSFKNIYLNVFNSFKYFKKYRQYRKWQKAIYKGILDKNEEKTKLLTIIFKEIKKEKKTIEYVESMKELLKIYDATSLSNLTAKIRYKFDELIVEGRYSRTYILIEEMLENQEEFHDCLFIIFDKENIDNFIKDNEELPIKFFQQFINKIDCNINSDKTSLYNQSLTHIGDLPHYTATE